MAKKGNAQLGGVLTFLGSLVYLYVYFSWYTSGYAIGGWVAAASFLGPFVIAVALFSAISLFFLGVGKISGRGPSDPKMAMNIGWQFVMWAAITFVILSGGTGWYLWSVIALLLTFVGAMLSYGG